MNHLNHNLKIILLIHLIINRQSLMITLNKTGILFNLRFKTLILMPSKLSKYKQDRITFHPNYKYPSILYSNQVRSIYSSHPNNCNNIISHNTNNNLLIPNTHKTLHKCNNQYPQLNNNNNLLFLFNQYNNKRLFSTLISYINRI